MSDIDALASWFETLSADTVRQIGEYYSADASFKDPFNDVDVMLTNLIPTILTDPRGFSVISVKDLDTFSLNVQIS